MQINIIRLSLQMFNYREVLAGMDVPKISPAIFCVIEDDDKNVDLFMEYIDSSK